MLLGKIIYGGSTSLLLKVIKSDSSYIWDDKGKKYIDFTSGWHCSNLGWHNKEVIEAVHKQLDTLSSAYLWSECEIQEQYADLLTQSLPNSLSYIGKATGGTEANDMAIKIARIFTSRRKILGFNNSYHGQSEILLSLMSHFRDFQIMKNIDASSSDLVTIDFPRYSPGESAEDILNDFRKNLETALSGNDVAAVIAEGGLISGYGSTDTAPKGMVKILREITKKYNTLLIMDEVGTGFSRTGKLFSFELEGIVPDIVTFAKASTNGVAPMGTVVVSKEIGESCHQFSGFISTYGWHPLACAAAYKVLEIHNRDRVWQKAEKDSTYIRNILNTELKDHPCFSQINGIGMIIGVEFNDPQFLDCSMRLASEKGLYTAFGGGNNIQLMPSLTIDQNVLDDALGIFLESIKATPPTMIL